MRTLWTTWALLLLQDTDPAKLVQDLGDPSAAVRDASEQQLRRLGPQALEAVKKGCDSSDPEIRTRASGIMRDIEQETAAKEAKQRQRSTKLRLVTCDVSDVTLDEALKIFNKETGVRFETDTIDVSRKVRIREQSAPLGQVLYRLGLACSWSSNGTSCRLDPLPSDSVFQFTDGVSFNFQLLSFESDGTRVGYVVKTRTEQSFEGLSYWTIKRITAKGKAVAIETCAEHSPDKVFIRQPEPPTFDVVVTGIRWWYADLSMSISDPAEGMRRRVGSFEIELQWPKIIIRSDQPVPEDVLKKCISFGDIRCVVREGIELPRYGGRLGGKRLNGQKRPQGTSWCTCKDGPRPGEPKAPPATREYPYEFTGKESTLKVTDLKEIALRFHWPVEEKFELTSPPLK